MEEAEKLRSRGMVEGIKEVSGAGKTLETDEESMTN